MEDTFEPLFDNVLIEKHTGEREEKKTSSGLIIPMESVKTPNTATVIAIGPDVVSVQNGDTVVVGDFSGTKVVLDDDEYYVMSVKDILGIYM